MHPAPSEGGRREGERSALQPLWQGQQCLGPQDLPPCPEKLEMLTGALPLLDSYENLEESPRGEMDATDLAAGGYGFMETLHLLGLWTCPECPRAHICLSL